MNPFLGGDAGLVEDAVLAVAPVSGAEKVGEVIGSAAAAVGVEAVVLAVVVPLPEVGSVLGDAVVVEQTAPFGITEQLVGPKTWAVKISDVEEKICISLSIQGDHSGSFEHPLSPKQRLH